MEYVDRPAYSLEELKKLKLDVRYDNIFKAVFTDEANPQSIAALSALLSAVIDRGLAVKSISQNEPATGFIDEKRVRYDVNCVFADGSRCNVEMTLYPLDCESYRIEYYLAKAHTSQPTKGKKYSGLVPTYQVSIINRAIIGDGEFYHSFEMYDRKRNISMGGRMEAYTVELEKIAATAHSKPVGDMTPLERWSAYFLYNADTSEFGKNLVDEITRMEDGVKMATQVMQGFSVDEEQFFRLVSEQKYEMDHYTAMAEAEERAWQRAEAAIEAERQRADRMEAERTAAIEKLKSQGVSDEVIARAFGKF
jgi:predicted transposase/invertase (TIGR01784 family)